MEAIHGVCWHRVQRGVIFALGLFLAATLASAAPAQRLLVVGDSLSSAYGLRTAQGWVALTAQRMQRTHPGWQVVNASISGETSAGGAARFERELARSRPAVVVIALGANDGLRGLSPAQTRANLERMLRAATAAKAKVLLVGMRLPPNYGPAYTRDFERVFVELANRHRARLLPFLLAPIAMERSAFQADNLHPTAAAQPKLRDHVWTALEPLLR